jgi:hypothetical protein
MQHREMKKHTVCLLLSTNCLMAERRKKEEGRKGKKDK